MTQKQKRKFQTLCKQMRELLAEMEPEHPDIQIFIDDGVMYLMDWPHAAPPREHILANGGVWQRSGGGGF
jgi:hypothetical protein